VITPGLFYPARQILNSLPRVFCGATGYRK
jgi:hypothetical protein